MDQLFMLSKRCPLNSKANNAYLTPKLQLLYMHSQERHQLLQTYIVLLHKGELYHNFTYIKSQVDMTSISHTPTNQAD